MTTTMPITLELQTQSAKEVVDITARVEALIGGGSGGRCHLLLVTPPVGSMDSTTGMERQTRSDVDRTLGMQERRPSMAKLVAARAWCNNEVAYLVWKTDGKIDGCLGFMITRIQLDLNGQEVERRNLPTWVAFATQSNPKWEEQDTSVWPIQKFSWRDLTLRKSRNTLTRRPPAFKAKYEIVPVGLPGPGRAPVPPSPTAQPGKYKGAPIPLFICGDSIQTDEILVTSDFGDIPVTFTNGILSTQNLRKQLGTPDGLAPTKPQIDAHIQKPGDPIRTFLAGDVLPALRSLFERADQVDGHVHLALYELDDPELENLLVTHQTRLDLIE